MINISPVGGLITTRREPSEGGVMPKMNADAAVGVEGDKRGGETQHRAALMIWESETCFPSFTYCFLSTWRSVMDFSRRSKVLVFGGTGTTMEFLKQAGTTIKRAPSLMQLLSIKVCNILCKP